MRILPTSFSKSLFLTLLLSLAAHGAFAQTEVNITGTPAPAAEGSPSGTTNFVFTLTRTGPAVAFDATYTITGDVLAPEDYPPLPGTVNFTAAQTTRTITVGIRRDTKFEIDEDITLTLTGANNGVVVGASFTATTQVLNDDTPPVISIGNRTVTEGNVATFPVTLSNASYQAVSVTATTADGTANGVVTAPFPQADYTTNAPGGTVVTFAANTTTLSQNFAVPTVNDTVYEGGSLGTPETFFVNLSAPVNGAIGTGTGNGLITDNDAVPTVSVSGGPGSQSESISTYPFTVTLIRPSIDTVTVTATAVDGTAQQTAGIFAVADFAPTAVPLTFLPGEVSKIVNVAINEDVLDEANETFSVQLSSLVNANPGTLSRNGQINDNDNPPALSIVATSSPVSEGAGTATFTVNLSGISGQTVSVNAQTAAIGAATAGVDYTVTGPNLLTWAPGDTTPKTLVVPITNDALDEAAETFRGTLSGVVNASVSPSFATMTITDDDPIPTVSISDASVTEGNTPSTTTASFTVSLSAASGQTITVVANTANGTATTANNDYVPRSNVTLTFSPLQTSQQFNVTVNGDDVLENDENFVVNLSLPSATVTIADAQGAGTINNDDSPALSIDDAQIGETNAGQVALTFDVHIPGPAPVGGVAFDFDTSDGTATLADNDYDQVIGGSGFISAGNTTTTVTVLVNGDTKVEAFETVTVTISNASLPSFPLGIVTILDATAAGTINNDDAIQPGQLVISEFRLSGPNGVNDEFVEIANTTSADITVFTTDGSAGFSVAKFPGTKVFTIPNGTTIPARGHYLAANSIGYSLANYGGLNAANANVTWTSGINDDVGLALFATDTPAVYGASTPLDAVGFTPQVATQYIEGPTGLTGIGSGPFAHNYSFVRKHQIGPGAALQDTGNSATDFVLVAVDAGTYGSTNAILGGPSPENLAAETEQWNTQVTMSGGGGSFTGIPGLAPKALEFPRTFTNNTGGTLTALRFKIASLTTLNSPGGVADLRPTDSGASGPFLGLTLEGMPSAGYIVTTPAAAPYPAGTSPNGGLNSTWRLVTGPIAALGTVDVNFRVEYTLSGLPYLLWVVPEAK